jgi:hypothetical protein
MPGRPGPCGTRIYKKKPGGRAHGVPATPAEAAAARVAALKHGGYSTQVSVQEARAIVVNRKLGIGAAEVLDAYHYAIANGDTRGTDALAARGMADLELLRRDLVSKVKKHGSVLKESIVSPASGEILGERLKLHPAVEPVAKFSELLGHTSAARRLDPKARGEGARDEALARNLERDNLLRGLSKDGMPLPPTEDDVIDAEVLGDGSSHPDDGFLRASRLADLES